ncbi:hypothetical protein [Deinococcus soli (ex Cha et al. 2016)]|uniref:Uncharacterized protein n=2 Tax=Deinococcus soli (ex Cha et al. 2016) TaxID=1309411 RepID=A0AAE3XDK5_9DEIO|nr:hypothetical protein [Deinococcus soli (ex Cha et al. 2016)]MDR6218903.1 hypothetical protein [Deinococcus soli (ex Cha et al. 2016)]MDR6328700.1 hypothetical protein [Deinococcus soli (ex Cha et al. 2016)]MDR6751813.1 hypothetical protein [Deinococcus soli (ex Cha et al. 2016)]
MSETTLIGLLHLRSTRHPQWSDTFDHAPGENTWGVPRDVLLPELFVGGLPFQAFAQAFLTRHAALSAAPALDGQPHVEGGWFRLEREARGEVTLTCCDCGEPGCGSTQATATPGTLGGVPGTFLSGWFAQGDPGARLPLPRVFIPAAAWPELTPKQAGAGPWPGPRLSLLLQEGRDSRAAATRQAAVTRWQGARTVMLAAARQAARDLPDPWGRGLELRDWLRRARADQRALWAADRQQRAERLTPEGLRAAHDRRLRTLEADERQARLGVISFDGVPTLLRGPAPPSGEELTRWLDCLAAQRVALTRQLERNLHLAALSARDRRVQRREDRRAAQPDTPDARALLRSMGVTRRIRRPA